ncbi:hypothetical protein G6F64_014544 [Rhizopus arrhizus]|uniref:Uncharacterized protein n=1 Tax=Rhizopus oryzae TaxID=64495 RepID=A0A9P6WT85_RHIOR|nr:hypothetical protein G6F64_014544 [Rhizopus arrhizus]
MKRSNALPTTSATVTSLVLPEQLAQQAADAVRELLAEAAAANTTRSYATALRYWAGWHQGRYGVELALPVSEAVRTATEAGSSLGGRWSQGQGRAAQALDCGPTRGRSVHSTQAQAPSQPL